MLVPEMLARPVSICRDETSPRVSCRAVLTSVDYSTPSFESQSLCGNESPSWHVFYRANRSEANTCVSEANRTSPRRSEPKRTEAKAAMDDLLTAKEAADILGYSDTLIRQRIKSGDLPATKDGGSWRISRTDVEAQKAKNGRSEANRSSPKRTEVTGEAKRSEVVSEDSFGEANRSEVRPSEAEFAELVARISRLDEDKVHLREELGVTRAEAGRREELSKARIVDLERELTMRDSRIADVEAARDSDVAGLREQVAVLEAKVREVLETGKEDALQLANRIASLVDRQQESDARIYELQPVAAQVPMLQAAVEEKVASLSEREQALEDRERELGNMRSDIETIASRPVTGPVFRLLTKGKLRR